MTEAVEGSYRNGVIELSTVPEDIQESRVLVTFLAPKSKQSKMITLGMFKGDRPSTEADFAIAECRGENGLQITDLFGTIDYAEDYDYKQQRQIA